MRFHAPTSASVRRPVAALAGLAVGSLSLAFTPTASASYGTCSAPVLMLRRSPIEQIEFAGIAPGETQVLLSSDPSPHQRFHMESPDVSASSDKLRLRLYRTSDCSSGAPICDSASPSTFSGKHHDPVGRRWVYYCQVVTPLHNPLDHTRLIVKVTNSGSTVTSYQLYERPF